MHDILFKLSIWNDDLLSCVSSHCHTLILLHILRSNLQAYWHTLYSRNKTFIDYTLESKGVWRRLRITWRTNVYLQLPVIELPARWVVVTKVRFCPDLCFLQPGEILWALSQQELLLSLGQRRCDTTGNDDHLKKQKVNMWETSEVLTEAWPSQHNWYLQTSHSGWQNQAHVVSMHHSEYSNGACCYTPWVLIGQLLLTRLLRVFKHDLKHPRKVLAQMMWCGTLRDHKAKDLNLGSRQVYTPTLMGLFFFFNVRIEYRKKNQSYLKENSFSC